MQVTDSLLSQILAKENMTKAYNRVCANKGTAGVDGIGIDQIQAYMNTHWARIKAEIQQRQYRPQPVLRVDIPKANGGQRQLGIPTVVDRIIQQAIAQVLTPIFEPHFADTSYGFRPKRNCEMAIAKTLENLNNGYIWVVDIDLEKFFDQVPQDKLMTFSSIKLQKVISPTPSHSLGNTCKLG